MNDKDPLKDNIDAIKQACERLKMDSIEMEEFFLDSSKSLKRIRFFSSIVLVLTTLSLVIALFYMLSNPEGKKYFEKASIKATMQKTIVNGGELSSLKHIYDTRHNKKLILDLFSDKKNNYYTEDYPLSSILNDLLVDYYQHPDSNDSTYLSSLKELIAENGKQNPFDNLEDNQKYNFQNIQEKLDSSYNTIAPDVIKIADELNNKNQLVTRYLNKSETSFTISIIALAITVIIGLIQLYQNYRSSNRLKQVESFINKLNQNHSTDNDNS